MTKDGVRGPKREQVTNACTACRLSKLKCNGRHPTCYRCHARDLECVYDVSEGMTKRQHLNNELSEQKSELTQASAVLRVLQFGTDQEATASLARLRIGSTVGQEYQLLQAHSKPSLPEGVPVHVSRQQRAINTTRLQSETFAPWGCPPTTEAFSGSQQYEWDDSASDQLADWPQPCQIAREDSSGTVYSAVDSPLLDMALPTPASDGSLDDRKPCIGG
ncbi:unnamed protein product [Zymoseptoria tritici ST99CH_1A5]|nr:unnamed protein product [Zymoseptoria tritici ST99CH_1E4]SMR52294.1 unnamed protein product [Zymoseptoria tritici ST99CH_3D1]SMY23936.1 unnamed protein product [Zymoseptoria tritici ST99CH_1A5]